MFVGSTTLKFTGEGLLTALKPWRRVPCSCIFPLHSLTFLSPTPHPIPGRQETPSVPLHSPTRKPKSHHPIKKMTVILRCPWPLVTSHRPASSTVCLPWLNSETACGHQALVGICSGLDQAGGEWQEPRNPV